MKKMKTCEEYVLKELADYKDMVRDLLDDRKVVGKVMEQVKEILDIMAIDLF